MKVVTLKKYMGL